MGVKMHRLLFFYAIAMPIVSECWSPIEDIPIEYYQPEEYQESHIDHEILLRPSRTTASSSEQADLKEHFFRSFDDESYPEIDFEKGNLPRPGGFIMHSRLVDSVVARRKRQLTEESTTATTTKIEPNIEAELGTGPLELDTLNPLLVSTESTHSTTENVTPRGVPEGELILINDFIRFRREVGDIPEHEVRKKHDDNLKKEANPKSDKQIFTKSAKISLENDNLDVENNREPRGLTRQEWVKFPYHLQRSNDAYADSSQSASDLIKAPRVHFVTQRRSENVENPLVYRIERQGRDSALSREARGNMNIREKEWAFGPRFPRRNEPSPGYPQERYDPRRNDFRGRYDSRNPMEDRRFPPPSSSPSYAGNRQRRIIYYANLPEITRSPPGVDLRDRYRHRDAYPERYPIDPYSRKTYGNSRLDEGERNRGPYPLQVSKDVNVREVKKNPERRIYSEVERKFGYNSPSFDDQRESRL